MKRKRFTKLLMSIGVCPYDARDCADIVSSGNRTAGTLNHVLKIHGFDRRANTVSYQANWDLARDFVADARRERNGKL